jgi:TPR repeat protein
MNTNERQDAEKTEKSPEGFYWTSPRRTLQVLVLSILGSFVIKMNIGYHGWVLPHYLGAAMADGVLISLAAAIIVLGLLLFTKFTLPTGSSKPLGFLAALAIPSLCAAPLVIWRTSAGLVDRSEDRRIVDQLLNDTSGEQTEQSQSAKRESEKTAETAAYSKTSSDAPDDNRDLARLKSLAQSGDALSQALLGHALCHGTYNKTGIKTDKEEGVKWIMKSSEAEHPLGLYLMGSLRGNSPAGVNKWVEQDNEAARQDVEKALKMGLQFGAEKGGAVWQHAWGGFLTREIAMPRNHPEAIKWYRKAAEQGDATAEGTLGICYYYGSGVSRDMRKGVKWFEMAAEHGDAESARYLGMHYEHGCDTMVPRDWKEAEKWYRMAAEHGDGYSASVLSRHFERGVTKDLEEAIKWCRIAIDSGGGGCVERDLEILVNTKKRDDDYKVSFEAHRKSAEQGDARAQLALGIDYYGGMGTIEDSAEAAKWFRRSADQGNSGAQWMLGMAYANGYGVPKNRIIAYMWYNLAAASEKPEFKRELEKLTTLMTKEEVAEGQRMCSEWKPKQSSANH